MKIIYNQNYLKHENFNINKIQEDFIANIFNYKAAKNIENQLLIYNNPEKFSIYYYNWKYNLIKSLKHIYSVTEKLTGISFFETMSNFYISTNPSTFFSLNEYGKNFSDFVKNYKPASTLVYLSDIAKLEWCIHSTLIGIDTINIDKHEILFMLEKAINGDIELELVLSENVNLITSKYPIYQIWNLNQQNEIQDIDIISLEEGGNNILVWRKAFELKLDIITDERYHFLSKLKKPIKLLDFIFDEINNDNKTINEIMSIITHFILNNIIHFHVYT